MSRAMPQSMLFPESVQRALRQLPIIGEQRDITYYATQARSILNGPETTGMGFWSINPYIGCAFGCAYCYARYTHRYVMERAAAADRLVDTTASAVRTLPPWLAFERHILVKRNAPEVLRRTLVQGSERHLALVRGETIVIGTATDPYQPAERRFRITRGLLEVLAQHPGLRVNITTKSPLVTRDIDVLRRIARISRLTVHLSLITLDRALARRLEPRSPTPEARLRALERLRAADVDAGIFCMPVLPGITDGPEALAALVARAAAAGATHLVAGALRLQHEARKRYLPFLAQEFPHLAARYQVAYAHGHSPHPRYREGLKRFIAALCRRHGIPTARHGGDVPDDDDTARAAAEAAAASAAQLAFDL